MTKSRLSIHGLILITPNILKDDRGYFFESYRESELISEMNGASFVQENESLSNKGVLRGLHLQSPPFGQAKLVRVVRGRILDIAVDVRKNSATYGQHVMIELNESDKQSFLIPEGFAHGFVCLEDQTVVQYKCSSYYKKESESGVRWDDPELGIEWPQMDFIISDKDKQLPYLRDFVSPY
ncbi:MAG: dTDP-4-dehydrorhamnose 3,5-epimerase [Flavobacteriales bacterium]